MTELENVVRGRVEVTDRPLARVLPQGEASDGQAWPLSWIDTVPRVRQSRRRPGQSRRGGGRRDAAHRVALRPALAPVQSCAATVKLDEPELAAYLQPGRPRKARFRAAATTPSPPHGSSHRINRAKRIRRRAGTSNVRAAVAQSAATPLGRMRSRRRSKYPAEPSNRSCLDGKPRRVRQAA